MPNPEKIEPYKFKKGQSGNPNGRPPNRVPKTLQKVMTKTKAKKFTGLSNEEINDWEAALLTMELDEIKLLSREAEAPIYVRGLAMAILVEAKNGVCKTLERLRANVYGQAKRTYELTGANGSDLVPARVLTKDEAKQLLEELEKEY